MRAAIAVALSLTITLHSKAADASKAVNVTNTVPAGQVALLCSPQKSHLILLPDGSDLSSRRRFAEQHLLDYMALEIWGPGPFGPYPHRKGSRTRTLECGRYKVEFAVGFLNTNPQGESGAVEEFPVATVTTGGKAIVESMAMAPCETADLPRFSKDNADSVEVAWLEGAGTQVVLTETTCPNFSEPRTEKRTFLLK